MQVLEFIVLHIDVRTCVLTAKLCLYRVNLSPLSKIDPVYVNDRKELLILTKKCWQIVEKVVCIIAATWLISAHMSLDSRTFGILLTIINSLLSILTQQCCVIRMAKGCIAITETLQITVFSVLQVAAPGIQSHLFSLGPCATICLFAISTALSTL